MSYPIQHSYEIICMWISSIVIGGGGGGGGGGG